MKKLILISIMIATVYSSSAQDVKMDCREKMMVGIKAGMNYSSVYGTNEADFHPSFISGFVGGVFINVPINKFLGVQTEILYSQKGFHATGSMFGTHYEFTRNTTYIDFPVLFAIMPNQYISLLVGPQFAYLINQKNVYKNGTTSVVQESAFNSDNSRKNNIGIVAGIDINYKHFVLGARGGWGLQYNNGSGTAPTPSYKNLCYKTTLGYRFNIKNVCGNDVRRNY